MLPFLSCPASSSGSVIVKGLQCWGDGTVLSAHFSFCSFHCQILLLWLWLTLGFGVLAASQSVCWYKLIANVEISFKGLKGLSQPSFSFFAIQLWDMLKFKIQLYLQYFITIIISHPPHSLLFSDFGGPVIPRTCGRLPLGEVVTKDRVHVSRAEGMCKKEEDLHHPLAGFLLVAGDGQFLQRA